MESEQNQTWLTRPIHPAFPAITNEVVIFVIIILLAFATRFFKLEDRVMSHDESLHTYFSWLLYRGQGYQHSPMMHGPFQFHILALAYFLFGATDFTARIPSVLFSIATVAMVWSWRKYLGQWGALIAGLLLVISPYMLYYGRYVRNESFVAFSGMLMLYAVLRHLELGGKKYLFLLAGALALHFTSKETSYIYVAELLIYLAVYFFAKITRKPWRENLSDYRAFVILLSVAVLLAGATVGFGLYTRDATHASGTATIAPADPANPTPQAALQSASSLAVMLLATATLLTLISAGFFCVRGYTWQRLRVERSFDLLMVAGTIVLPLLAPFPINLVEKQYNLVIPTTFEEIQTLDPKAMLIIGIFLILMFAIAVVIGLFWNSEMFLKTAAIFWIPYVVLYTTFFTNSAGFFTGTIGSLGYWIVQQDVNRGSQPWFYYLLVQIPVYEFLPALGFILALFIGVPKLIKVSKLSLEETNLEETNLEETNEESVYEISNAQLSEQKNFFNTFSLLAYWSVMSFIAFTFAGERMPWLTVHMTLPLILITGWALGQIIERTDWNALRENRAALTIGVIIIFIASLSSTLIAFYGPTPPFQGKEIAQLQATNAFILPFIAMWLSLIGAVYLLRDWTFSMVNRVFVLTFFAFLAVLTGRAAFRASYITYDQATEFLVYAHGATGIKEIIQQAKEISERTTGGMGIALAYDASAPDTGVSWPFVWYLRDFTNQRTFDQPTRALRESTIIIVDQKNFDKIEAAIGPGYYRTDYIRMWWPMQDYFNLVSDRDPTEPFPEDYKCSGLLSFLKLRKTKDYSNFCEGFTDPAIRAGLIQIWLNRDYTRYAQAKDRQDLTVATWQPSNGMRMYIKSDVASQIWNYGIVENSQTETQVDPTEGKFVVIPADVQLSGMQADSIPLNAPRSLAFASDGTFYVADSRNNRVLHLNQAGDILHVWGTFADGTNIPIGNGTFNEPWGIAVGPDGSVYVTDVWNHRIERFTATGKFLKAWGYFGQGEAPEAFYGPRGLATDSAGRVYVTDTGNKRVVVFDANGNALAEFGGAGYEPGQFDEPVGITVDKNGTVYVVDTWNQRVQTFRPQESDGQLSFVPDKQWDVYGWFGQSVDNKPFIAVNDQLHVFITDPEGYRVMEFDPNGTLIRTWGEYGETETQFGLASGIAVDPEGHVWVTDSFFNRILRFTLP
ncbi:MAG: TIGR03663 family protein [Anaerolineales bacterium]|nr:TIGR03663 family protein [Anaerolineales bacterium]